MLCWSCEVLCWHSQLTHNLSKRMLLVAVSSTSRYCNYDAMWFTNAIVDVIYVTIKTAKRIRYYESFNIKDRPVSAYWWNRRQRKPRVTWISIWPSPSTRRGQSNTHSRCSSRSRTSVRSYTRLCEPSLDEWWTFRPCILYGHREMSDTADEAA